MNNVSNSIFEEVEGSEDKNMPLFRGQFEDERRSERALRIGFRIGQLGHPTLPTGCGGIVLPPKRHSAIGRLRSGHFDVAAGTGSSCTGMWLEIWAVFV